MSLAETKKQEISELWGLSTFEIDNKLAMLQSIICDTPDYVLLDYLLKADLNIDHAINLHFGSTPSPSPPLIFFNSNSNNNHNHNNKLENDDDDDIEILNNNNNNSGSSNNNHNHNHSNRKRKRDEIYDDSNSPPNKRRKINLNHDNIQNNQQNTNNSNSNNSNTNNQQNTNNSNNSNSSNDINNNNNNHNHNHNSNSHSSNSSMENEINMNKININDEYYRNWKRKLIGVLKVEYSQKKACTVGNLVNLSSAIQHKKITLQNIQRLSHLKDKRRVSKLYTDCINELQCAFHRSISTKLKNTQRIPGTIQEENDYQHKYNECIRAEKERLSRNYPNRISDPPWIRYIENSAKNKVSIGKPGTFMMEFEIELIRHNTATTSFSLDIPYTMALFGGSKRLFDNIMNTIKIGDKYKKNKHIYSMVSLLDFSCRYQYKINAFNNNESYNHGLNVKLHEYQLQSLHFMLQEEHDPVGFYRHFYESGCFNDDTSFQYSTTFNNLIVNDTLPIAHGGFLCEEMGLGKTVISLALINCNGKSMELKDGLKIAHTETRQKSRWENDDIVVGSDEIQVPKLVQYTEEYKWYKSRATLIIAPVSLVGQWEKECDTKSTLKKLKYIRYYGSRSRNVRAYICQDIVFTTYGILAHENGDDRSKHILHQIEWHRIILDESHYIKNGNCNTSKHILQLRGINKWCLTGTPFGRQIYDIYNQLKFIGLKNEHLNTLNLRTISNMKIFNGNKAGNTADKRESALMNVMQCMVMRHKKAQKFNDKAIVIMPEKKENVIFVEFTAKQKEYYDKLYATAQERFNYYKTTGNIGRGCISILASLHPARQACSGYIYSKSNIEQELSLAQTKTFRIKNMVQQNANLNLSRQELFEMAKDEAFNTDGECPICFECPFDEPLQTPCRHIYCRECIISFLNTKQECPMCRKKVKISQLKKPPSNNAVQDEKEDIDININDKKEEINDEEIRFDSKLKVLMNELNKIRRSQPNEKSLIFTSFSKSLSWMCNELCKNGFEYRTLTGCMSMNKRKKQLDEFATNANVKVFVLTVRSGAVGITLTSANHVFMLEPPFNAALHRQAINRVYRLGQKKNVFIHTLIMKNSIEEKIWNINKCRNSKSNDNSANSHNLAGNISGDKSANLQQHEISKLFE